MRSDRERELVSPITSGATAEALQERCAAILEQIAPDRFDGKSALQFSLAESHVGLIHLRPVSVDKRLDGGRVESVCVEMFPVSQAQKCNCEVLDARFEGASELIDKGWTVRPWLTFRYRAFIRCQPGVRLDADRSLSFWHARSGMIRAERDRQLDSGVWRGAWEATGLVQTDDRQHISAGFSQKHEVNVCPAWRLRFSWSLAEAERLDSLRVSPDSQQTVFVGAVLRRMRESFDAMGQDFLV